MTYIVIIFILIIVVSFLSVKLCLVKRQLRKMAEQMQEQDETTVSVEFVDKDLEELVLSGKNNKYKKYSRDGLFMQNLISVINTLKATERTDDLKQFSFFHYVKLKGCDVSSVRVMNGRVERLIFNELNDGIEIVVLELNVTHYGNKK